MKKYIYINSDVFNELYYIYINTLVGKLIKKVIKYKALNLFYNILKENNWKLKTKKKFLLFFYFPC